MESVGERLASAEVDEVGIVAIMRLAVSFDSGSFEHSRIRRSLTFLSALLKTSRRTVGLDVGWVQSQVAASAAVVIVVVLPILTLILLVLLVLLLSLLLILLILLLVVLLALATLALTEASKASSSKASELSIGNTSCE